MVISQREARRLRRRVEALERLIRNERGVYGQEYKGVEIARLSWGVNDADATAIRVATKLSHKVVVVESNGTIRFMAMPHMSEPV